MKNRFYIFFIYLTFLIIPGSCIESFVPETNEDLELLVVEGLITDKPEVNTVRLSRSLPLGRKKVLKPIKGALVRITDDMGYTHTLTEKVTGTYVTNPVVFTGQVGRSYVLNIDTKTALISGSHLFQSASVLMKPVPDIDSVAYKKVVIGYSQVTERPIEGCQIYVNTNDENNQCRFYRWDYSETWEFRIPFAIPNYKCWITGNSKKIDIKSTAALQESRVSDYPLLYITNETDRLSEKYSIMVNQYSLSEDEYYYWEKLQNISENVGSLYDITPANVNSNVYCTQDPAQRVLGYFSVSAKSSKRIFIDEYFSGQRNFYTECIADTVYGRGPIAGLGVYFWVIEDQTSSLINPYRVLTDQKRCADCTTRGTNVEPLFWRDDRN